MLNAVLASVGCAFVLASCATPATQGPVVSVAETRAEAQRQSEYVVERRLAELRRIHDVAARVKVANLANCPAKAPWLGATFNSLDDFGKSFKTAARGVVGERLQPLWIAAQGPAARAGLQAGDTLLATNGQAAPTGKGASAAAAKRIRKQLDQGAVILRVERAGAPLDLVVPREETCGYDVFVDDDAEANAYADGRDIHVYRGILKAVESDDELALVIAHELAHNTMDHVGKQRRNALIGALAGALLDVAAASGGSDTQGAFSKAGAQMTGAAYSQAFEAEADYVGMYYLAQAGYRTDGVEAFWRRMAAEDPKQIRVGSSHPSTAARFVGIQATREEIARKTANGEPLRPTPKPAGKPASS